MVINSWTESYGDEMFGSFNMSRLKIDEAYLDVNNKSSRDYRIYSVYDECYKCSFSEENLGMGQNRISTHFAKIYRVALRNQVESNIHCESSDFGEFGVYNLTITDDACTFEILKEPVNIYFPILTVFLIYALFFTILISAMHVLKVHVGKPERQTTSDDVFYSKTKSKRLKSLDTIRGISIVIMIFANFGCGGYQILDHSVWNGLQFADLVFPWFMWIMGVCIPISTVSLIKKEIPIRTALLSVLKRSCILFTIGLFLGSGISLNTLRIFGVLQRFGISYLIVASSFIIFSSGLQVTEQKSRLANYVIDVIAMKYEWVIAVLLIIVHSILTFLLPVPDCPQGYLGPGGYHDNGKHSHCTGGSAGYIDELILGNHILRWGHILKIYKSEYFDPEGILGCLPSIVQTFIGAQAGVTILFYKKDKSRILRWLLWAFILGLLAGILCCFSKEGGAIPMNKNLWSLSFVFATSSFAFILLSICYILIDVHDYWNGKPFLFAGMNSIIMYVGHSILINYFPLRWIPNSEMGFQTHFIFLIENVWATSAWVLISYYLYKKKYFLSI